MLRSNKLNACFMYCNGIRIGFLPSIIHGRHYKVLLCFTMANTFRQELIGGLAMHIFSQFQIMILIFKIETKHKPQPAKVKAASGKGNYWG